MKFLNINLLLFCCTTFCAAQTPSDRAFNKVLETLGKLSLGTTVADFLVQKPNLPAPDNMMGFRYEIVETIEKDGLQSVIYYFGAAGSQPLYELIIEFSSAEIRDAVIEKLFGKANHPTQADQWILGVHDGVVSIGWSFGQKFALAANFPGTEWTGDAKFDLPKGFELHKNLPLPTEWPAAEIARFFEDLQLQLDATASNFEKIKGERTDGGFASKQAIGVAESSVIAEDPVGYWQIRNKLTSDMEIEKAVDWQASLGSLFDSRTLSRYRLARGNFKTIMGTTAGIWNVSDSNGQPTGWQVATVRAGKGLFSVFVVVLRA